MSSSSPEKEPASTGARPTMMESNTANEGKDRKLPALPSFTGRSGDPLYESISSAVSITNAALARVEEKTEVVSNSVLSRMRSVGNQARHVFSNALVLYERRGQYGPQLVAGSALAFGGIIGLRRGRIPGIVVGSMAGATAYANVYGVASFGLKKKFD